MEELHSTQSNVNVSVVNHKKLVQIIRNNKMTVCTVPFLSMYYVYVCARFV